MTSVAMPEATVPALRSASGPRTNSGAGQTMHAARPVRRKNEPGRTRAPGNPVTGRRCPAGSAWPADRDGRSTTSGSARNSCSYGEPQRSLGRSLTNGSPAQDGPGGRCQVRTAARCRRRKPAWSWPSRMVSTRRPLIFGVPAGSALKDRQAHASHTAPRSAIVVRLRPRERRIIEHDMLADVHDGFYLRERGTDHRCQARPGCLSAMIMAGEPR